MKDQNNLQVHWNLLCCSDAENVPKILWKSKCNFQLPTCFLPMKNIFHCFGPSKFHFICIQVFIRTLNGFYCAAHLTVATKQTFSQVSQSGSTKFAWRTHLLAKVLTFLTPCQQTLYRLGRAEVLFFLSHKFYRSLLCLLFGISEEYGSLGRKDEPPPVPFRTLFLKTVTLSSIWRCEETRIRQ